VQKQFYNLNIYQNHEQPPKVKEILISAFEKPAQQKGLTFRDHTHSEQIDALDFNMVTRVTIGLNVLYKNLNNTAAKEGVWTSKDGSLHVSYRRDLQLLWHRFRILSLLKKEDSFQLFQVEDTYSPRRDTLVVKVMNLNYTHMGYNEYEKYHILNQSPERFEETVWRLVRVFTFQKHFCLGFEPITTILGQSRGQVGAHNLDFVREIAVQLLRSLAFLHSNNIVHNNLNPENVFFKSPKNPLSIRLGNLGNSFITGTFEPFSSNLNNYSIPPPETLYGTKKGPETDMWDLGCLLMEIYLGQPLNSKNPSPHKNLEKYCGVPDHQDIPVRERLSDAEPSFVNFIEGLLCCEAKARFNTSEALCHQFLPSLGIFLGAQILKSNTLKNSRKFDEISVPDPQTPDADELDKVLVCSTCGYTCKQLSKLKTHSRVHTGERPFLCETCGYSCSQVGNLNTHKRIHTGEKPFRCDTCGFAFREVGNLRKHQRVHTGEKPFVCETCGYSCGQKSSLNTHYRTHTGEKPFVCDICGYSCSIVGNLNTHKRVHTGEKPFVCQLCGYACRFSGNLKKHKKRKHDDKIEPIPTEHMKIN
jgi:serine/threonine protein kinase